MKTFTLPFSSRLGRPGHWPRLSERTVGLLSVVVLLALWELLSRAGLLSVYHFPRPSKLAMTLWELIWVGFPKGITVSRHIWATVWRILQGYLLATALALPLGLVIGANRLLDKATNPLITFARSVAAISLLPLMVAWFGVGQLSRVLLITYACFWIILTNVIEGVKQVDVDLIRAGQMLGASRRQLFFRVLLPATLPRIFAGMKIALGMAFLVIVAVEMIGTIEGLGALIMEARTFYRSDAAMVGMIFMALFGFLLVKILDRVEQWLLPWAPDLEEVQR
jgi:ABC-type nitrate/sulfonate/bicarbonate transport system permease component